eukprot:TRINITY_DN3349_c0_g1_i13.p1 TRINITY_DN3349_c0_g1~~TRINITY_DN3349_c0_g1_i13.p1  ORF type:complete len:977 (-),score=170.49 TRINITY_DN3349_c0_g1_i13:472-3402(-)
MSLPPRPITARAAVSGPEFVRLLGTFVKSHEFDFLKGSLKFTVNASSLHYLNDRYKAMQAPLFDLQERKSLTEMFLVIHQLPSLKLEPSPIGIDDSLGFNISMFHSVRFLEIEGCNVLMIQGLNRIFPQLRKLVCHKCLHHISDILVKSLHETALDAISAAKKDWKKLRSLDCSYNSLSIIDESLSVLPNVRHINLSYNRIALITNLEYCYALERLDLSHNRISSVEEVYTVLGNVVHLNLSANYITSTLGLDRLYGLEVLDISKNMIEDIEEIERLATLPLLNSLYTDGNPVCITKNYRKTTFSFFNDRDEFLLDGRAPTIDEIAPEANPFVIVENVQNSPSNSMVTPVNGQRKATPKLGPDIAPYRALAPGDTLAEHVQRIRSENLENWLEILEKLQSEADLHDKTLQEYLSQQQDQLQTANGILEHSHPSNSMNGLLSPTLSPDTPTSILNQRRLAPKKRNTVKFADESQGHGAPSSIILADTPPSATSSSLTDTNLTKDAKRLVWGSSDGTGLASDIYPILCPHSLGSEFVTQHDEKPAEFDPDSFHRKYVVDVSGSSTRLVCIIGAAVLEMDIDSGRILVRREVNKVVDSYPDQGGNGVLKIEFEIAPYSSTTSTMKKIEVVCYKFENQAALSDFHLILTSVRQGAEERSNGEVDLSSSDGYSIASSPGLRDITFSLKNAEPALKVQEATDPVLICEQTQSYTALNSPVSISSSLTQESRDALETSSELDDEIDPNLDAHLRASVLRSKVEKYKLYMCCGYVKYGMKLVDERIAHVCLTDNAIYLVREKKLNSKYETVFSLSPTQIRRISVGMSGQLIRLEPTANTSHVILVRDKTKTEKFIDVMNLTWIAGRRIPPHLELYFFDAETQSMVSELVEDVEGDEAMIDLYLFVHMIYFGQDSCRTKLDHRPVTGRTLVLTRERIYLLVDDYCRWPPLLGSPWPTSSQFSLQQSISMSEVVCLVSRSFSFHLS